MDGYCICSSVGPHPPTLADPPCDRKALLILSIPPISPSPFPIRDPPPKTKVLDPRLEALDVLVKSVNLVPYNWSAWLKIAACIDGGEEVSSSFPSRDFEFTSFGSSKRR